MNNAKSQATGLSFNAIAIAIAQSASGQSAGADRKPQRRHSVITQDLYSYRRYKTWTQKIRAMVADDTKRSR